MRRQSAVSTGRKSNTTSTPTAAAVAPKLLSPDACRALASLYPDDARFRSTIVMARHGFGRGEYKYFADPLPDIVGHLRGDLYRPLAPIANRWNETMGVALRYPAEHGAFRAACRAAGQARPTPLLLRYGSGDFNCLHQDVYGALVFPLQVAILLSAPGRDFTGGEFVLTEQRPRMQSRAEVVSLGQGDGVVFAVRERPVLGTRGPYRVSAPPRRQPHQERRAVHARHHLPRRDVSDVQTPAHEPLGCRSRLALPFRPDWWGIDRSAERQPGGT